MFNLSRYSEQVESNHEIRCLAINCSHALPNVLLVVKYYILVVSW